ncbi:hypothetical protein K523DRAFT_86897 [Schizophyllum commune Tattone D]|nr:hypothetical protein K523DRAFT_86897 [Schizophyllum commune Tattone D]
MIACGKDAYVVVTLVNLALQLDRKAIARNTANHAQRLRPRTCASNIWSAISGQRASLVGRAVQARELHLRSLSPIDNERRRAPFKIPSTFIANHGLQDTLARLARLVPPKDLPSSDSKVAYIVFGPVDFRILDISRYRAVAQRRSLTSAKCELGTYTRSSPISRKRDSRVHSCVCFVTCPAPRANVPASVNIEARFMPDCFRPISNRGRTVPKPDQVFRRSQPCPCM